MTQTIKFTIPINPKGAQRPRFTKRGHAYTHKDMVNFQATVRDFAYRIMTCEETPAYNIIHNPFTGPVELNVIFYFKRPLSKIWKIKDMPQYRYTSTPDIDNLLKNILDGLNGVVWLDDRQVCKSMQEKWVCAGEDNRPRIEIEIRELSN